MEVEALEGSLWIWRGQWDRHLAWSSLGKPPQSSPQSYGEAWWVFVVLFVCLFEGIVPDSPGQSRNRYWLVFLGLLGFRPAEHEAPSRHQACWGTSWLGEEAASPSQVLLAQAEAAASGPWTYIEHHLDTYIWRTLSSRLYFGFFTGALDLFQKHRFTNKTLNLKTKHRKTNKNKQTNP